MMASKRMRLHCSNRLPPNCCVFSTGTRSIASASAASVLFGVRVNKITSAPSALAILAKLTLTGVSPDPETITSPSHLRIDGGGDFADRMDVAANMHESHRRHLSGQP